MLTVRHLQGKGSADRIHPLGTLTRRAPAPYQPGFVPVKKTVRIFLLAPLVLPALAYGQQMPMLQPGSFGTGPLSSGYIDAVAGLTYTDNAQLSQGNHTSDGIGSLGLEADYARTGRLSLSLLGDIQRVQYIRNSFSGSFYGNFNGSALWGKPTDPLQWVLSDSFGEGATNPLGAPTPQNLQTVNYLTTGPFLNLNFGLRNRFTVYGEYARSTYERSPYDSQTFEGGVQLAHQLAGATSISVQASDARTEYLDRAALINSPAAGSTFNIKQAAIQFQGQYVRTNILLAAGYNILDSTDTKHGSPYYNLQISRNISPFSTIYVGGQSSYSTFGATLQSPTAQLGMQSGGTFGIGFITAQPVQQRRATAGWNFHRDRTSFNLGGTYADDLYPQVPTDNHRDESLNFSISRQLQPTVSIGLQATGGYNDYRQLGAKTHQYTATLTLAKQFAKSTISLYLRRMQQSGSPGASGFAAASYYDDQVGVYFTYDLFGQRNQVGAGGAGMGMPGLPGGL